MNRVWLGVSLLLFGLSSPGKAGEDDQSLPAPYPKAVLAEMSEIANEVQTKDIRELQVSTFRGPPDAPPCGDAITRPLAYCLEAKGIKLTQSAPHEISGGYDFVLDSVSRQLAVLVDWEVIERKEGTSVLRGKRGLFDETTLLTLSGVTVSLPVSSRNKRRERLESRLDRPEVHLSGARVSAEAGSPYEIEVLVKRADDGEYPLRLDSKKGYAFADLPPGTRYAIRLINHSPYAAAAALWIDGVSVFAFAEDEPGKRYSHFIVPARDSVTVQGWYINNHWSRLFVKDKGEDGSAATLPGDGGAITATFAAAWEDSETPPEDEARTIEDHSLYTAPGPVVSHQYESPRLRTGRIRSAISLRLDDGPGGQSVGRVARIGAVKLSARTARHFVVYEPLTAWPGAAPLQNLHKAAEQDRLAFVVSAFEQVPAADAGRDYNIDDGGEIIAAAIARQLDALRFFVVVELAGDREQLPPELREKSAADFERFARRAEISGTVDFGIRHQPASSGFQTTAVLHVKVQVSSRGGGQTQRIYEREFKDSETLPCAGLAQRTETAKKTAAALLARFVQGFLTDPNLETSLLRALDQR